MRLELVGHSIRIGLLLVLLGGRAQAQIPADSLLRLAPADAGITVEIDHLREAVAAIRNSAPVANFQNRPVISVLGQVPELPELSARRVPCGSTPRGGSGHGRERALRRVRGPHAPRPPGEPLDSARGLLLVRVRTSRCWTGS